jgi:SHS2 domain-containing protein
MASSTPKYTLLNHTADLGIKIRGSDLKDLYEAAARAMIHLTIKGESQRDSHTLKISLSADDLEDLMVRWLGEILYLFEAEHIVVTAVNIESISSTHLEASLETVPFEPQIHEILTELKAITYHQIKVASKGHHWEARVIIDV